MTRSSLSSYSPKFSFRTFTVCPPSVYKVSSSSLHGCLIPNTSEKNNYICTVTYFISFISNSFTKEPTN